ncbi:MAG: universal stress protein [Tissierellia bacterium]|nr:universal stress protein [Tissierellia bacterium]
MKNILVAIDGSKESKYILEVAKTFQEAFSCQITVLTVSPGLGHFTSNYSFAREINQVTEDFFKEALDKAKTLFKDTDSVSFLFKEGKPAQVIVETAQELEADLIILGNRGLGAFSRTQLGSVSDKVAQMTSAHVFVVKEGRG